MAYIRKPRTYLLEWPDDHPVLPGLVVRVKPLPIGALLGLTELIPLIGALKTDTVSDDAITVARGAFELIEDALVSWDIQEEDPATGTLTTVPATLEGLLSLEPHEIEEIFRAWVEAVTGVPTPLGQPSPDGAVNETAIPMEPLPENPQLSPTPN